VLPPLGGHEGWVFVAVSPDGNHIVSGSEDMIIHVWDLSSATALSPFRGHENAVTSITFSSDGDHIISGSADRIVRIWDTLLGAEATSPL
jgi:WD40 repeat protein